MKTTIEIEVLKIEQAKSYNSVEPEHKAVLTYKETKETALGIEQAFKTLKSMLPVDQHKIGKGVFEVKIVPYINQNTKRAELSIKILKQVK